MEREALSLSPSRGFAVLYFKSTRGPRCAKIGSMEFLKDLVQHPLFAIGTFVISLFLAVVGIVLTIRSRRVKQPCWDITSNNLISGFSSKLPSLEISYGQQKV